MYEIILTGGWYWFGLVPVAAVIFWIQYKNESGYTGTRPAIIIMAFAVFTGIVLLLTELKISTEKRHYLLPKIILMTDTSPSYNSGKFLGQKEKIDTLKTQIADHYRKLGFEIHRIQFSDVTDTSSLPASSMDSISGIQNIHALFLFTDGQGRVDFSLEKNKIFPVILPVDNFRDFNLVSYNEILPEKGLNPVRIITELKWKTAGIFKNPVNLGIYKNEKLIMPLQVIPVNNAIHQSEGILEISVPFKISDNKSQIEIRLLTEDDNKWNNKIKLNPVLNKKSFDIYFFKPVSCLDETWLINLLAESDANQVRVISSRDLKTVNKINSQLWISNHQYQIHKKYLEETYSGNLISYSIEGCQKFKKEYDELEHVEVYQLVFLVL